MAISESAPHLWQEECAGWCDVGGAAAGRGPRPVRESAPHSIHTLVVIDSARNPAAVAAIATTSVRSSPNAPTTIRTSAPCSGGGGGEAELAAAVVVVEVVVQVVVAAGCRRTVQPGGCHEGLVEWEWAMVSVGA